MRQLVSQDLEFILHRAVPAQPGAALLLSVTVASRDAEAGVHGLLSSPPQSVLLRVYFAVAVLFLTCKEAKERIVLQ